MDGFNTSNHVIVFAGTNRADILDSAILRPGRFDRKIMVDVPDIKGRKEIAKIYLKDKKLDGDIEKYAERISELTPGFTGAEIANICNESAIMAARNNQTTINEKNVESGVDRVVGGIEKKTKIITKSEKELISIHESGHATISWFLKFADPLMKITIIPRGPVGLGYAQYLPSESALYTKAQLIDKICTALAGRVSEEILLNKITTGAQNDIEKANSIVRSMVTKFGMSEKIGLLCELKNEIGRGVLR